MVQDSRRTARDREQLSLSQIVVLTMWDEWLCGRGGADVSVTVLPEITAGVVEV